MKQEVPNEMLSSLYFDAALYNCPFLSVEEQMLDCVCLVNMHLHCITLLRQEIENGSDLPIHLRGVVVKSDDIHSVIMSDIALNQDISFLEELRKDVEFGWSHVESRIQSTAMIQSMPLVRLIKHFKLTRFQSLCLFLAYAARVDRKYESIFSYLHGHPKMLCPSLGLALSLYDLLGTADICDCINFCVKPIWRLLFEGGQNGLSSPFQLKDHVFFALAGKITIDPLITFFTEHLRCDDALEPMLFAKPVCDTLCNAVMKTQNNNTRIAFQLYGEKGSGRLFCIRHFAACVKLDLMLIRTDELLAGEPQQVLDRMWAVVSSAAVGSLVPVFLECDNLQEYSGVVGMYDLLQQSGIKYLFLHSNQSLPLHGDRYYTSIRLEMRPPSVQETINLWYAAVGNHFADDIDFTGFAYKYHLNPGQINTAVENARLRSSQEMICEQNIIDAIFENGQETLLQQCTHITPIFCFGDLILPEVPKGQIRRVLDRIINSYHVNVKWGFGKKYAYGSGVSVLLYGSPGTGKTMCAHVLASELKLGLYKVDLSMMVSKYIGETEKNLSEVFREAQKSNSILFFDEADSLFSQRSTDSGNSNDKYANMETAHLLQKIEEFQGISILATNLAGAFDKAFYRRIHFIINIPLPDAQTRSLIWKKSFPINCPIADNVDFNLLGMHYETSPSTIKSAALVAAFRAVAAGCEEVGMCHIMAGLRSELFKEGRTLYKQEMMGFDEEPL